MPEGEERAGTPGTRGMQTWDLEAPSKVPPVLKVVPYYSHRWEACAITPDGSIVAAASYYALFAVDLRKGKLLWEAGPLDSGDYVGRRLAVGNKGRNLFTAGARSIDRWDLATGQHLAVLATNSMIVHFLSTSHDGSVLIAGRGSFNSFPASFTLWETSKDEPLLQFPELNLSGIGISPDGQQIAMSRWGQQKSEIYDWYKHQRREIRLRCPYAASSAYALYWSPDGKLLAAYVNTYPSSVVIYDTVAWKPLAQWECGAPGQASGFVYTRSGMLVEGVREFARSA